MMSKTFILNRRYSVGTVDSKEMFLFFRWHVDKLEFKANNQPSRYPFYDRSLRRVPTPSEQVFIDYKNEVEAKKAKEPSLKPVTV
jgi:hypothetical protein